MEKDSKTTPHPGSNEALDMGCICPVVDNGRGRGVMGEGEKFGWWINGNCPIHHEQLKGK